MSTVLSRATFALIAAGLCAAAQAAEPTACTDFDAYVNGRWLASAELPPNRARIGSFDTLRVGADRLLTQALGELVAEPTRQTSPGLKLLATYYRSGMDEAAIERRGLAAFKPWLVRIDALTREGLPVLLGELARLQISAPVALSVGTDAKDISRTVLSMTQSGLGLTDREDYLGNDERALQLRAAYRRYAQSLLAAAGAAPDEAALDALIGLESAFARASLARAQRRDPAAQYNPMDVETLQSRAPDFNWRAWLGAYTGRPESVGTLPLVVGQPAFMQAVAQLAQETPLPVWRQYLRLRLLDAGAEHGPAALQQPHFAYRRTAIRGLAEPPPRSEQVILAISGGTGNLPLAQALGELYVTQAFLPKAQARARLMLDDLRAAMRQRIARLDWMSAATKTQALAKLEAMVAKIGAPEQWRRYDGLTLESDDYAGNLIRVREWSTAQRLSDLGKPVDRARWFTSPHIVNAFAGGGNQITFPAAILQPPFFDADADDASDYGAIGSVIGHEITHHFDDRGRQFDAVGNLRDWWTPEDAAAYKARAQRVAQLYGEIEVMPGARINGLATLGENISDFSGLQIAFEGLQIALARQRSAGRPVPLIDSQTPEQRFFVANAVIWRGKMRPQAMLDQLRTDGHSPGRWRILAPMSNHPGFAQAFGCKAGDAMVAADPITIW